MSLTKPRFQCGAYDVSPENPSDWSVSEDIGINSQTTLGGELREDMTYRKYVYQLTWDAMSVDDYDDLLEIVQYSLDNGLPITFTWGKFPSSTSGVGVRVRMGARDRRGGSGSTGYYSTVTIVITEVEAQ